jgi:N-acylglucosamine 2-epimerase
MCLQGMQVWVFAMIYNKAAKKEQWLNVAKHGADFMMKYGKDHNNNWYFAVDQKGQPLTQPYDIFSDCYASMAFYELYIATNDITYKKIAIATYNNILARSKEAQ